MKNRYRLRRGSLWLAGLTLLFVLYLSGLSRNPPGFYVDESGIAYNAFLIAHTGKSEAGQRFPLFFQFYGPDWTEWANPTQVYLLAIPFRVFRPGIWLARVSSASWVFAACLLLGFLAKRISANPRIGILVGLMALLTPWLFEVSRLVFETFFYPMALVLFLTAVYQAQQKQKWSWLNAGFLAASLMLLTYSYTIGRLLGPLLAAGLVLFATSGERIFSIARTWSLYAVSLIPLLIFRSKHPQALTERFYAISYIKPGTSWREILPKFIRRFCEDLSLVSLLFDGDENLRHHVAHSLGSFLIGVFVLAAIGFLVVIVRYWRKPWWRFIVFGALAAIVPGALTEDHFHSLRLIAYPIFLLILTIPALQFLLERPAIESGAHDENSTRLIAGHSRPLSTRARHLILGLLLLATAAQTIYFQSVFRREGPTRGLWFDADYKGMYDAAVAQPDRPIYLVDGSSPAYVHAFWYATVEGRDLSQFVHLSDGTPAPAGSIVISSEETCSNCEMLKKSGEYLLYRSKLDAMSIQRNDLSR
jgi:Dolichyl-phosphate-mannose-protein mannosyltransferase